MKWLVLIALTGCASAYQSARPLAPGKTQVTASVSNARSTDSGEDETVWTGDVQVRTGASDRADVGIRLGRVPSANETASELFVDVKARLTEAEATTVISVALPVGVYWVQQGFDFENGVLMLAPSVFFGAELSPQLELVFSPKLVWLLPDASADDDAYGFAGSIGLRIGDGTRTWAIQPELSLTKIFDEGSESDALITIGVGVSAGN